MAISEDFENMVADLKTELSSRIDEVQRIKKEVHDDLDSFKKEFASQSKDMRSELKEDVNRRKNEVKELLEKQQAELQEVRSDIQQMHKIWINRKSP